MANSLIKAAKEFKDFVSQGNVVSLATAVVFGVAFNAIITSFITNIITPILGIPGHINVANMTLTLNGSTISYGLFINAVLNFIVIAAVLFFLVIKPFSKPPQTKDCPYCYSKLQMKATRCAFCTSKLPKTA